MVLTENFFQKNNIGRMATESYRVCIAIIILQQAHQASILMRAYDVQFLPRK
jgi:hypothetical protein